MSFKDLDIKFDYRSAEDNIALDFMIPILSEANIYKRAVGYFSSTALQKLSIGLSKLAEKGGKIYIVASPKLSEEDIDAINLGLEEKEKIINNTLLRAWREPKTYYEEERLNLLANLIAKGIMEIKIAYMENNNKISLYHEKIGVVYDLIGNKIGFIGSNNESANGYEGNFESLEVFCSWKSEESFERVESKENAFEKLWNNNTSKVNVIDFPKDTLSKILSYKKGKPNYNIDELEFSSINKVSEDNITFNFQLKNRIEIPIGKKLFEYQLNAIDSWEKNNYQGIYDMATGTGKTYTALGSIERLSRNLKDNIAVFVLCPYIHLVNQWAEDVKTWNIVPIICYSGAMKGKWYGNLVNAKKRFKTLKRSFICIISNATFTSDKVQNIINLFNKEDNVLIVVDEAHYFGAEKLSTFLPENIKYRLALSATLERYGDEIGTKKLYDYFGEKCIEYPLERAIKEGVLVPYYYHPIIVNLTDYELDEYRKLSKELVKYLEKKNGKITISEAGKYIAFKRSRLVAGASNKLSTLKKELRNNVNETHILIYCGATSNGNGESNEKSNKQILQIQKMIGNDLGMVTHKFTAEENAQQREHIKRAFASGAYQVITAIKCLDEGVNIPQIKIAYILASSKNPKEFIQRRGRLLRKSPETKKTFATIYDFITLPRLLENVIPEDYKLDKSLISGEILRMIEFSKHSLNEGETDLLIEKIKEAYGINLFTGDDWEQEDESYE